jgi:uncharacterized protein DUF1737
MGKIVEYQVVSGYDPLLQRHSTETLSNVVRHLIQQGWQPLGGVAVTADPHGTDKIFVQAMVKYE